MVTVKLFHQIMIRPFFIINFCLISYISLANEGPSFSHTVAEMKTVEGNFSQQVIDQRGSVMQEVGGNFLFKKPNLFKWNYIDPIQSQIISDGELLYLYDPDLKQVVISSLKKLGGVSPAMLLVSSSASEHFIVKSIRATDHISIYEATPKNPQEASFSKVLIHFNQGLLSQMHIIDNFNHKTKIYFDSIVNNRLINDAAFLFNVPEGVDVIKN
jgi:outer membrane lipoprotein carrier protein